MKNEESEYRVICPECSSELTASKFGKYSHISFYCNACKCIFGISLNNLGDSQEKEGEWSYDRARRRGDS